MSFRFTPWLARAALAVLSCAALGAALGMQWNAWYTAASTEESHAMMRRATGAAFGVLGPGGAALLQDCPPALISLGILLLQLAPLLAFVTVGATQARPSLSVTAREMCLGWCALQLSCLTAFLSLALSMRELLSEPTLRASFMSWTWLWLWRSALVALPYVALASLMARLTRAVWSRVLLFTGVVLLQRVVAVGLLRVAPWALLPAVTDRQLFRYEPGSVLHGVCAAVFWFVLFVALGSRRTRSQSLTVTTTNGEAVPCS